MRNRFKGLDLIDRVPDELWTEVRDIVQETGSKDLPQEKEMQKAKWLSGEALQIAVIRREAKSKGEKERYPFECRIPKNSKERMDNVYPISKWLHKHIQWFIYNIS